MGVSSSIFALLGVAGGLGFHVVLCTYISCTWCWFAWCIVRQCIVRWELDTWRLFGMGDIANAIDAKIRYNIPSFSRSP